MLSGYVASELKLRIVFDLVGTKGMVLQNDQSFIDYMKEGVMSAYLSLIVFQLGESLYFLGSFFKFSSI